MGVQGQVGTTSTRAVVFCDVVSSTDIRARLGDQAADEWFEQLLRSITNAVVAVDGIVVKSLGDGVMAVFTSATAALNGAVGMQHAAVDHSELNRVEPAQIRVGVSIGDVAELDNDWNGMPVVEAARLCAVAATSEILASDVVRLLAGSRSNHTFMPAGTYELKGIPDPVDAVRVEWSPPTHVSLEHELPSVLQIARRGPFVGREALVAECFDEWKAGEWRTLLVAGEPGIGKTRFVAELCSRVVETRAKVLIGRCDEDVAAAYRPWTEALDPLLQTMSVAGLEAFVAQNGAELAHVVPALHRRVSDLPPFLDADAATVQGLVIDAVIAFLLCNADDAPLVIVLDDVHWIDPASLVIMRRIAEGTAANVSIIATYRDTDLNRMHPLSAALADLRRVPATRRVALDGLDEGAVEDFMRIAGGYALDAEGVRLAAAVHEETAGNPLFVGEMLRHLAESGAIRRSDDRWVADAAISLPEGLREVIGRRLTRLGDDVCAVLRLAAVVGRSFDPDVLQAVLSRDVLDQLDVAAATGIVVEVGRNYEFRHAVLRDVLLSELSSARSQRLHRDIVAVLEARWTLTLDQHLDELAYHHYEAHTDDAAHWCLRAANAASANMQFDQAVEWSDRGLELIELADVADQATRCDLLIARSLGSTQSAFDQGITASKQAFEAAVALNDEQRMAESLLTIGLPTTGALAHEHIDFLKASLERLHDFTAVDRWRVEGLLLTIEVVGPNITPAEFHDRVLRIIEHLDPNDPQACAAAGRLLDGVVYMNQARLAEAIVERYPAPDGDGSTWGIPPDRIVGHMRLNLGDREGFERGLDDYERGLGPGIRWWLAGAGLRQSRAMAALLDGRWDDARRFVAEIREVAPHDGNFALGCQTQDAWIQRETGEVEAVYQLTRQLAELLPDLVVLKATLVLEAAEAGHVSEVVELLDEFAPDDFVAVGRGWLTLGAFSFLAWGAVTADAHQHAPVLRRLLQPYAGQMAVYASGVYVISSIDRLLAGLAALDGDHAESDRLFAAAFAQEQALSAPPLVARTQHWWARALIRRGEPERAPALIESARATASELGMTHLVTQLDELTASL